MAEFEPVLLVDPNGAEYLAVSPVTLNNLVCAGYTRKNGNVQVAQEKPEIVANDTEPAAIAPDASDASEPEKPDANSRRPRATK
ncbi:hypothetical protein [Rhodococcus sp. ACS1]|uniref:hypothetical protein n=1 Tax=Rhodococcus sp. ACS1 TaxID=2028570 RepID=UPI00117AEF82|nr:hypothetical protein [Rhodococcus sp. ACS1]